MRIQKCLVWVLPVLLCAQQTNVQSLQDPGVPIFSSSTNLVVVDVYARDKSGKLMMNLTKDDFILLEDGKPQKIAVFEVQKLEGDLLPPLEDAPKTLVVRNAAAPVKEEPKKTGLIKFQDKRLISLFFDFSSMSPEDQIHAQDAAIDFLQKKMTSTDLVNIMTYSASLQVAQDFTDDRELLISVIKKFQLGASELNGLGDTGDAAEGDDTGQFVADETEFNIFNTDQKLAALEVAARKLQAFPEKKALVYFSAGIPKTGVENQSQLRATVNAAVRSNVAFYPIDTTGLKAEAPSGDASVASPRGTGVFTGSHQRGRVNARNDQQETLVTLAADTGGKALLENNDLTMGITQAQEDIKSYYILGYYSTNSNKDGRYRHIDIKMADKKSGVKLESRNGYYADKVFSKFSASDKERQLSDALMLGDPVSELPLAIEIDHFRIGKDRYFVPISVKIPGSAINLAKKGDKEQLELDFVGQIRDSHNTLVTAVRDGLVAKLTAEKVAQSGKKAFQYDTGVILQPGVYSLRFLARENIGGKMGTFETKFTVPDLNAEAKQLRLSSVVWSAQRESVKDAVATAEQKKKAFANHPLIQDGQRIIPNVTKVFRKDQTLYVYLEVYDPLVNAESKLPRVTAELTLTQGGKMAFESNAIMADQMNAARPGVLPMQFQVPLSKVGSGVFTAQVNVVDDQGEKFAFPRNRLVVLP